jgi:hypothetical protein
VPALTALGYDRECGNRFIRTLGTRALVIDVLAPSYLGRMMSNQTHGDLVVDETARDAAVHLHRHFGAPSSGGPRRATPNRTNQARIRALVARIVPNPSRM